MRSRRARLRARRARGSERPAVCLGGHWKRINTVVPKESDFDTNRARVVGRCIDRGINYIDACTGGEVMAYSKALKGRRDKMYQAVCEQFAV